MDRSKLEGLLQPFMLKCAEKGRALDVVCIEEAFPGDISTSYIVQIKARWLDGINCFDALDFLFDVLFETTEEETRRKVFSIQILNSQNELHYSSEQALTEIKAESV